MCYVSNNVYIFFDCSHLGFNLKHIFILYLFVTVAKTIGIFIFVGRVNVVLKLSAFTETDKHLNSMFRRDLLCINHSNNGG